MIFFGPTKLSFSVVRSGKRDLGFHLLFESLGLLDGARKLIVEALDLVLKVGIEIFARFLRYIDVCVGLVVHVVIAIRL